MFAHLHPHSPDFGDISAPYPPFLHQLIMQSSLLQPGRPVIFTCSTGKRGCHNERTIGEGGAVRGVGVHEGWAGGHTPLCPSSKNRVLHPIPTHTMHSLTWVSVVVCVAHKLRPCLSYSRRRDRINLGLLRSYDRGGGGVIFSIIFSLLPRGLVLGGWVVWPGGGGPPDHPPPPHVCG